MHLTPSTVFSIWVSVPSIGTKRPFSLVPEEIFPIAQSVVTPTSGVDPLTMIKDVKESFLKAGGVLLEEKGFQQAEVYDDAVRARSLRALPVILRKILTCKHQVVVTIEQKQGARNVAKGAGGDAAFDDEGSAGTTERLTAKLMLDAMGNFSPVMRQVMSHK